MRLPTAFQVRRQGVRRNNKDTLQQRNRKMGAREGIDLFKFAAPTLYAGSSESSSELVLDLGPQHEKIEISRRQLP